MRACPVVVELFVFPQNHHPYIISHISNRASSKRTVHQHVPSTWQNIPFRRRSASRMTLLSKRSAESQLGSSAPTSAARTFLSEMSSRQAQSQYTHSHQHNPCHAHLALNCRTNYFSLMQKSRCTSTAAMSMRPQT
jgi:hypothetical protein